MIYKKYTLMFKYSDNIYSKNKGNAFSNPNLDSFLKQKHINDVFIVGLDATACVYKTSIGAINKGHKEIVLKDALIISNIGRILKIVVEYSNEGILLTTVQNFIS